MPGLVIYSRKHLNVQVEMAGQVGLGCRAVMVYNTCNLW